MTWRKSSHSGSGGDCVEVRGDLAAVRDSKAPRAVMPVGREAMSRLIQVLRAGQ
ncbi:DUF397 domain-containing protein [Actinophytocola sp.]|uniref:DUF397 domain-containing protein n=1 Tax=Actinophytocola sp. TaxID=1872138 RepID=UPI00389A9928